MQNIKRKPPVYLEAWVLDVGINLISLEEILTGIENLVKYNKKDQITTPNPEQIVLAQKDKLFKQIINKSKIAICDGMGLFWAIKWLHPNLRVNSSIRISGVDLMTKLMELAYQKKWRVFLLGGREDVCFTAKSNLKEFYPGLKIAVDPGAQDIKKTNLKENKEIIKKINHFRPQLLFVAYGAPYQEKWISANLKNLNVNLAMGIGGAFDYLAGRIPRAPKIVRQLGLEWLWRLIIEPWRIKRQLNLLKFIYLVIKEKLN